MSEDIQNIKLDIGLLKKDIQQTDYFGKKLAESIEKIQEVNINLLKMISLHEQKHDQHEKTENELKEDIKELHSRITTVNRELLDRIDEVEENISLKIQDLRNELLDHKQADKNKVGTVLKEIDKYKWMLFGAAIAVGWILGNVNLTTLAQLIK